MVSIPRIGDVEKRKETTKYEWKITDFFSVSKELIISSPIFYFGDTSLFLIAVFRSIRKPEFMTLELRTSLPQKMEYQFGLKKADSSVECLSQGILKQTDWRSGECYIKLSEVEQRKAELAPSDTLTVTCTLKHEATDSDQLKRLNLPKTKKLKRLNTLSDNFRDLFLNKDSCDTTLQVMDKYYKVHKTVLMARSPVFAAMFLHETLEKQTGIVNITDCDPDSFGEFLEFLYTGKLEKQFSRSALHLYEISDKYDVQELKTFCVEFLVESLTVENLCDIVIFADIYDDKKLLSAAQDYFNKNVNEIFETSKWDSLVKSNYSLSKKLLKEALPVKNLR